MSLQENPFADGLRDTTRVEFTRNSSVCSTVEAVQIPKHQDLVLLTVEVVVLRPPSL